MATKKIKMICLNCIYLEGEKRNHYCVFINNQGKKIKYPEDNYCDSYTGLNGD